MEKFLGYRCSLCNQEYGPDELTYTCPKDGGNVDVVLDTALIRKSCQISEITGSQEPSLWRYLPLLPVSEPGGRGTPLHIAGYTPVFSLRTLAKKLGLSDLWIKDESRNPTASFKDRASAVVVGRAREIHAEIVVTASTGNAGAALAGMSASIGQEAIIFAPRTAPAAKIAQLLVYGSQVILVDGNYDQAFDLSIEASHEFGWYCRNTGYNPFTAEGKKTAAFEIWETVLRPFIKNNPKNRRSLAIFIPVGDGNIISGIHKGFKDLQDIGWLDIMPRLFGVQAEGSASVYNTYFSGNELIQPINAETIADSIAVDLPRDGVRAVRAARQTNGDYLTVKDDDILKAISTLGSEGLFAEPAGAAAYAGLEKAVQNGLVDAADPILVLNTGSGLKDIKAAMDAVQPAAVIEPTLGALKKFLKV